MGGGSPDKEREERVRRKESPTMFANLFCGDGDGGRDPIQ